MVYKRVRGCTSGRSLPILNFVRYPPPPEQLGEQNTVTVFLVIAGTLLGDLNREFLVKQNNMKHLSAGIFTAKLLRSIIENSL